MTDDSPPRPWEFGRWPWSWPVEVPARIKLDSGGIATVTEKGVVYDHAANVGKGYRGTVVYPDPHDPSPLPITLSWMVGRSYLRKQLKSGEWTVLDIAGQA